MKIGKSWKPFLTAHLKKIVFLLIAVQPVLDVISYMLSEMGNNLFSTLLRFAMLAAVGLLGFLITDRKRAYLCVYGVMAAFWLLHVLNGFRIGYISVYQDTANYLRILTLPVFLLSFLTFFRKRGNEMREVVAIGFAVNIGLSVLFTVLPWGLAALGLGEPVYTYDKLYVGVMGWFAIPNAQSCVIVLLTPLTLLLAYRTRKLWLFLPACAACFGLMFVTGTKLTFYSIFLIPAAFIFVILLNPGRREAIPFMAVLIGVVVLAVVFRSHSPMQIRENMSNYSQGIFNDLVEESLTETGASEEVMKAIREGKVEEVDKTASQEAQKDAARRLAEVRHSLLGVYTDPEVYGDVLVDLNDRFGVYNVMAVYHYSASSGALSDLRLRKTNYAKLVWAECDLPTKLLGFEYSQMLHNGNVYDLENDFPAVYYNCGWLGFVLYLSLFAYVAFSVFRSFFRDPLHFLTMEMGAVGMTFVLALGAAQISGYVLRRPNVAIYLAVTAAYLCYLTVDCCPPKPEKSIWRQLFTLRRKKSRNTNGRV